MADETGSASRAMGMKAKPDLIVQHGVKRSGNHAISNWLLPKISCEYINNFIPVGPILSGDQPYPEPVSFQAWKTQFATNAQCFYISLEDLSLDAMPFSDTNLDVLNVLIIRHPDNIFASRIRKAFNTNMAAYPRRNDAIMQRAVGLWKQHALCYLNRSTLLSGRIAIYFDEWFRNQEYRAEICAKLQISTDNDTSENMTRHGGGSSFDNMSYADRPNEMSVLDRVLELNTAERNLLSEIYQDVEFLDLKEAVEKANPFEFL